MNFKLNALAAAALLLSSSGAFAAIDNSVANKTATGSGDVFFNLVSASNNASFTADLGLRLDQFIAAPVTGPGVKLVWDLRTGVFSDQSAVSTGLGSLLQTINYGNVYNTFGSTAVLGASDLKFDIKGGDGYYTGFAPSTGMVRYLSTADYAAITATNAQLMNMKNWNVMIDAGNADTTNSTHGMAAAGANMFDNGDGLNVNFEAGGDEWKFATSFRSTGAANAPLNFFYLSNSSNVSSAQATVTSLGAWSFDAGTAQLTYATAAPVPEAETYAMMLAGLGLVGFMVSRRRRLG